MAKMCEHPDYQKNVEVARRVMDQDPEIVQRAIEHEIVWWLQNSDSADRVEDLNDFLNRFEGFEELGVLCHRACEELRK